MADAERLGGKDNRFGYAACPATGQTDGTCPVTSIQVYGLAALKKQQGNDFFRSGDYESAISRYSDACRMVPTEHVYFLNRSKAYLKAGDAKKALEDAKTALEIDNNVKVLWQYATVLTALERRQDAIDVIRKAWEEIDREDAANKPLVLLEKELMAPESEVARSGKEAKPAAKGAKALAKGKKNNFLNAIGGNENRETVEAERVAPPQFSEKVRALTEKDNEEKERKDWLVEQKRIKQCAEGRKKIVDDCIQLMKDGVPRQGGKKRREEEKKSESKKPQKQSRGYEMYTEQQKDKLVIKGGHQFMPHKPVGIPMPPDFREPTGPIDAKKLGTYNCKNLRKMLSVMGYVFDVSDRPDKYGEDGPYWEICGKDITWGLYIGDDSPSTTNMFYDLFKMDDSCLESMMGVCGWIFHFTNEYGEPVGHLTEYRDYGYHLPEPPKFTKPDIGEQCCVQ